MQIPKEVYSMSDLSKRQMIINQLSNQHKTYTLFTNGNECAFSTTGIDNNVIKLEGSGSYYTNTTDNKEISIKSIVDKTFVVFSDSLKNEWDLYFDETIEVLGKKCTKAVYKKNRSVVAWFCQEIPSPVGPCGYIGLPGAILRLTTSSEIYEAESILPIKGQVKIELPRGKIMQKPAFEKLQKKKIEELKESGNDNVIVLSAERNVLMPSNDEYKRTSGIGNVNLTLKPTSHYNVTIGVIHNEMDAKSALSTEQHVKVAQEVIRKSTEENGKKRGNFSSFNLSQKWDVNPYASLRFQTKLAYSDMRNNMSIMDYYNNNSDRNADNDKNKGFNVLQQVNLNSLIGKGLLYGSVDFAFSKSERNLDVLSSYELPNEYKQADDSYYIDKDLKKLNVAGAVGYVFPIFHKINLKWELSGQNSDSWIDQNVDSEHLNSHNFGIYGGLMKNKGLFRFDAGVRFSDYGNSTNINGLVTKSVIKWEPSFATELRFSQQHSVAFGLSYKYVPTDIEALSRLSVINSYDEVTDASSYSRLGNNALNMNIAYKLYSLYSRTIIFMYLTYEKADNTEMLNYQNDGLLHSQNYMD